jgi:hypothetical protein
LFVGKTPFHRNDAYGILNNRLRGFKVEKQKDQTIARRAAGKTQIWFKVSLTQPFSRGPKGASLIGSLAGK